MLELFVFNCVIYIIIAFYISNKNIMSPSVLLCTGYLLSAICCLMNKKMWNVSIHFNTYLLLNIGIISFLGGQLIYEYNNWKRNRKVEQKEYSFKYLKISKYRTLVLLLINLLVLFVYYRTILNIVGNNYSSFSDVMNVFKKKITYENIEVPFISVQLVKISKAISYVLLFVIINNYFYNKKIDFFQIVPILIYILTTFLVGGRIQLISFIVASLFLVYFNWNKKNGFTLNLSVKFLKILVISFAIFVVIFYFAKNIVGRTTNRNMFEYITEYIGGSIQLLDEYMNEDSLLIDNGRVETFPGIVQSLQKIGFMKNINAKKQLEFRHVINNMYLGNVYTSLSRVYNDYGYGGIILIQFMYSYIFTGLYYGIKKNSKYTYNNIFGMIFYSYSLYSFLISSIEDSFFINIGLGYFIEIIIVYCIINIVIKKSDLKIKD